MNFKKGKKKEGGAVPVVSECSWFLNESTEATQRLWCLHSPCSEIRRKTIDRAAQPRPARPKSLVSRAGSRRGARGGQHHRCQQRRPCLARLQHCPAPLYTWFQSVCRWKVWTERLTRRFLTCFVLVRREQATVVQSVCSQRWKMQFRNN